ncbi:hypothetical protein [Cycloclasticus pugetii]|jgi:hypothetical protein|uniref:hypothetical protein n=1 Tax=Cycloclasticus pugetii TaxID=34068 RepID=UPI00091AE559|nr:hypothetical protein [Cycloclasticus pugetii]MDF1830620.1 hypothetical protein [Cycloclasticus pugetii]SHI38356.1 hypothetical protein SAMN05519226_0129 [Cycloclasticus pugetii]
MKNICFLLLLILVSGCTTVRYNGTDTFVKKVNYPEVGKVITVYVGDHLVQKGTITEESVLLVHKTIDGALYDIPAKKYPQVGYDQKQDFYSAVGVVKGGLSDPIKALALKKQEDAELCVITVFGGSACYQGEYERKKQLSEKGNSFQQTLIYSGRVGDKINIGYREFSNNTARPAFNNDVEYDLSSSNTIGYKGALIEVIKADNRSMTYKLIRNFP